ncbi:hypothetical protein Bbelb_125700, partial [Branchiostoma belcheri]
HQKICSEIENDTNVEQKLKRPSPTAELVIIVEYAWQGCRKVCSRCGEGRRGSCVVENPFSRRRKSRTDHTCMIQQAFPVRPFFWVYVFTLNWQNRKDVGHFGTWTLRHLDTSASGHFGTCTLRHLDSSALGHFGIRTLRHLHTSAPGQFATKLRTVRHYDDKMLLCQAVLAAGCRTILGQVPNRPGKGTEPFWARCRTVLDGAEVSRCRSVQDSPADDVGTSDVPAPRRQMVQPNSVRLEARDSSAKHFRTGARARSAHKQYFLGSLSRGTRRGETLPSALRLCQITDGVARVRARHGSSFPLGPSAATVRPECGHLSRGKFTYLKAVRVGLPRRQFRCYICNAVFILQSPRRWQKLSEVVRSYDVILSLDTLPEYQGEWYEVKIKSRHTTTSDTCHPTPQVSEVTVTSRNFRQLRTTSDTCHPTPQVSEVTVTSRNFRQLRTTSDTCHPTPQVSEVTVTSRNFRQLRTTSDTCHPTPQVSEVTVTSDFTPDNPQNHSEMVVTSDNFRQLLPP